MAFVVLLSLSRTIYEIRYERQFPISENGEQQIESLHERVNLLFDLLMKEFQKEAMTSLETRMRDAANEAEDVLEHFMYEHLHSHHKPITSTTDILYDFPELEIVIDEFDSIAEEVEVIQKEREQLGGGRPALMPAPAVETFTVGLEERVNELRDLLCYGKLQRKIIPITGMCGIGKTTLAKKLYEDQEVIHNFPLRAWITVSQNYNREDIFEHLLSSLEGVGEHGLVESSDSTEDKLHKIFSVNKFLIVVDDLWSGDAWDDIKKAFGDPLKRDGSRILITTRCLAKTYASTLRSVICFRPTESSLVGLRKFRLLRVLDVVDTEAYSLPPQVFELFHLRYLAFGCPMEIPAAISRLWNLRTLIIRPSKRLRRYSTDEVYLPLEIWMLPNLEHLVSFFDLLPNPEEVDSPQEELLTLSVVKKLICTRWLMATISNVKKLAVTYFGDKYQEDYQLHNLVLLHKLEKLTLVVEKGDHLRLKAKPVFPKRLKKLTLSGWRFPWEDMKAIAALPELQVLKLRDHAFEGDTWETDAGQFPKLKHLLIDESDLEKWVTQRDHFPALKRLVLNGCGKLKEIPDDMRDISTIEQMYEIYPELIC